MSAAENAECTYAQLSDWLAVFPPEQFLFLKHEDVTSRELWRRARVVNEVYYFLGLEPRPIPLGELNV